MPPMTRISLQLAIVRRRREGYGFGWRVRMLVEKEGIGNMWLALIVIEVTRVTRVPSSLDF